MIALFKPSGRRQHAIYMVLVTVSIDVIASSMLLAVLTKFAQEHGGDDAYVGAIYSLYSAGAVIAGIVGPKLTDKFGKKQVFLCTITGMTSGYLLQGLSTSFEMLLVARAYSGLFAFTISNTFAYISDVATPHERSSALAMVGGLISVCMIVGPVIGAGLSSYGLEVPFYGAALVCACNFLFTYYCLPKPEACVEGKEKEFMLQRAASFDGAETKLENLRKRLVKQQTHRDLSVLIKSAETEAEGVDVTSSPSHDTEDPLRLSTQESDGQTALPSPWTRAKIIAMGLVSMFNYMCFASISVLLPLLLSESKFGLTDGSNDEEGAKNVAEAVGYFYAGLGFVSAPAMVLLAPLLQKQFGMIFTATIGAAIHGLGMFMLLLPNTIGWVIPCLVLVGVGNGLVYPTIPAFLAAHSLPGQHTETLAVGQVFQQFASVVGPLASFLYAISATLAFVTAGGVSYINIFVLSLMAAYIGQQATGGRPKVDSKSSAAFADRVDKHIALKRDEYVADLQNHLIALLEERNYDLDRWRLQYAIKEIINTSFPFLRPGPSPEHEEDIRQLLKHLGHSDFNESVQVQEQNKMAFANMVKLQ